MAAFPQDQPPLLLPAIAAATLRVSVQFHVVRRHAHPGRARFATLEVEIYRTAVRLFNLPLAAVLAIIQMIFTLALLMVYTRLQARTGVPLNFRPSEATQRVPRTPGRRAVRLRQAGRVGSFLVAAFGWRCSLARSLRAEALSLQHYRSLFINRTDSVFFVTPIVAVRNSLTFATVAVFFSLLVGITSAYLLAGNGRSARPAGRSARSDLHVASRRQRRHAGPWLYHAGARCAAAQPARQPSDRAHGPHTHCLSLRLRALLPVLRGLNPRLREAAAALGASPLRVLRHIDMPILARVLIVGVVFAFTISMGEFGASLLVSRPQFPTLPMAIYRLLGQPGLANYGQALALSVILMLATAIGFLGIENLRRPVKLGDVNQSRRIAAFLVASGHHQVLPLRHRYHKLSRTPVLRGIDLRIAARRNGVPARSQRLRQNHPAAHLAGLEQADQGQVVVEGQDISHMPAHRRDFGLMFQDYVLFPHLNVADNIAFGLRMHDWPAERIASARGRVARVGGVWGLSANARSLNSAAVNSSALLCP